MGRKSEKEKGIERGLEAFSRYVKKCKQESKRPTSLQQFFRKYDPATLELAKGIPPLRRYVQRYQREMKKLEGNYK